MPWCFYLELVSTGLPHAHVVLKPDSGVMEENVDLRVSGLITACDQGLSAPVGPTGGRFILKIKQKGRGSHCLLDGGGGMALQTSTCSEIRARKDRMEGGGGESFQGRRAQTDGKTSATDGDLKLRHQTQNQKDRGGGGPPGSKAWRGWMQQVSGEDSGRPSSA